MFIFPPVMYLRTLWTRARETHSPLPLRTLALNAVLLVLGAGLGAFGTANSLAAAFRRR